MNVRKQLCRKRSSSPHGHQVKHESANAPLAKKANGILSCIKQSLASRSREVIRSPLLSIGEATTEGLGPVLGPPEHKRPDMLERAQWKGIEIIKGLERLSYEEGLGELGLSSLEKRKLGGNLISVYKYPEGRLQRGQRHAPISGARCQEKRQWAQTGTHLNASSLGRRLKSCLDVVLGNLLLVSLLEWGLVRLDDLQESLPTLTIL